MKILRCLLIIILTINNVKGQSNQECLNNLSIFAESAKIKNYDAAYDTWLLVLNECPKLNLAIYTYGEKILKHKIKNSSGDIRSTFKKDLISLYDKWVLNIPSRKGASRVGNILSTKAQALIDYKMADDATIYSVFDEAYKKDAASFTNPKGLYNYFDTLYKQYKSSGSSVSTEHLFNMYEEISEKLEYESTSLAKKLDKILIKEDNGEPLNKREVKNKRVYNINSKAIKNKMVEINTILKFEDKENSKLKSHFEMTYATIIQVNDDVKEKKELEKIILCDVQVEIYSDLEKALLDLLHNSGYPEVKFEKKVDFDGLYKQRFN